MICHRFRRRLSASSGRYHSTQKGCPVIRLVDVHAVQGPALASIACFARVPVCRSAAHLVIEHDDVGCPCF